MNPMGQTREAHQSLPRPLFVLGKHRSGTKWLVNSIAAHPDVYAVQRDEAGGVVETNLISRMRGAFGDLSDPVNRAGFRCLFEATNEFKIAGVEWNQLGNHDIEDEIDVLKGIMQQAALVRGASCWIIKANTWMGMELLSRFPDARVVIIQRALRQNVQSAIALKQGRRGNQGPLEVAKEVWKWYAAKHFADKLDRDHRCIRIWYDEMIADPNVCLPRVWKHLGLKESGTDLERPTDSKQFVPNTSFSKQARWRRLPRASLEATLFVSSIAFRFAPGWLLRAPFGMLEVARQVSGFGKEAGIFQVMTFSIEAKRRS